MRKKWYIGILLGVLSLLPTAIMAKSQVTLLGEIAYISNSGVEWVDTSADAPEIKITIDDAYKSAGKTEKLILELNEAYWTDESGTNLLFYDLENLSIRDIAIRPINKYSVQLNIDIPSNVTREDKVSFKLPLWIKSINDEEEISITVKPADDKQLTEEETLLLATKDTKRVTYEVQAIPELKKEGKIADITFTEISPYALHNQTLTIQLNLNSSHYAFGELDYLSKSEHDADIDYILSPNHYVTYGGGFSGLSEDVKLKRYKKTDQEIIFTIKGGYASELGTITLTNIPIIKKDSSSAEEEITVTLTSKSVAGLPKKVVVAKIVEQTTEEKVEEELKEMVEESEKQAKEEAQVQIEASKVTFKVGENYYIKGGQKYAMDGLTYIQDPGYTMVPLRYVAIALGLEEKDVQYFDGKINLVYETRQIELTVGSNIAKVNGNSIPMETAVVINKGRSYVPVGEVAKLMGVNREWDNSNKTAIFYK